MSSSVSVEVRGLTLRTHHGVTEAEQRTGQELVLDISLEPSECAALESDRIEETVDYGEVAEIAAEAATERSYRTLERLCQEIVRRLAERYAPEAIAVRAAKPDPPLERTLGEVAVEVRWRK